MNEVIMYFSLFICLLEISAVFIYKMAFMSFFVTFKVRI